MTKLQRIKEQLQELSSKEFAVFRKWFIAFEAEGWERQIERDILAQKLDPFRAEALREHSARKTKEL